MHNLKCQQFATLFNLPNSLIISIDFPVFVAIMYDVIRLHLKLGSRL